MMRHVLILLALTVTLNAEEKTTVEVERGTVVVKSSSGETTAEAGETVVVEKQRIAKKKGPNTNSSSRSSITIKGKTIEVSGDGDSSLSVTNGKVTIRCGETTITGDTMELTSGDKTYDISKTDKVSIRVKGDQIEVDTTAGTQVATKRKPLPDARVLAVRPELGLVMLSVGSNNGAKPGDQLTISRGEKFVSKAEIQKVFPDMCTARLFGKEVDVLVNDVATHRLVASMPAPPPPVPDPALAKRITALVKELGADDFTKRDVAHEKILQLGEMALRPLKETIASSKDPEIRFRCQKLVEALRIVRKIEVRGNARIDNDTILRMIRTRVGRSFNKHVWDDDWHRLADSGHFLNVRVTPPLDWQGGIRLVIDLVETAKVGGIDFKGNEAILKRALSGAIKSTVGGRYQAGQVHMDARALEKLYHDKAFRNAKVTYKVDTVASRKQQVSGKEREVQDEVAITFKIVEGHPISISKVSFVGNKAYNEAKLAEQIMSKPLGDLKDAELDIDKKRLKHWYFRNGYMDVSIDKVDVVVGDETYPSRFRKRKKLSEVTFHITEGPLYHVGKLEITGHKNVPLSEIRAVMKLKPGSVFSPMLLNEDAKRIKDLYREHGHVFANVSNDRKLVTDPQRVKGGKHLFDVSIEINDPEAVEIRVDQKGRYFLGDELITLEKLKVRLKEKAKAKTSQHVQIKADPQVKYANVVELMEECRRAGIEKISFGTTDEEKSRTK